MFVFVLFCFFFTTSLPPFRDMLSFLGFVQAMSGVVLCLSKDLLFVFFAGLLCFLTLLAFLQNCYLLKSEMLLLKYNTIIMKRKDDCRRYGGGTGAAMVVSVMVSGKGGGILRSKMETKFGQ